MISNFFYTAINWGVVLLYGQEVALNHLIYTKQIHMQKLKNQIDFPSGNIESVFSKIMIHVFHGDQL